MRFVSHLTSSLGLVAAAACAPRTTPSVVPSPVGSGIPTTLQGFRLVETEQIPERDGGGQLYRFTDGTGVQLTVFVYPVPADVQQGDSANWVLVEGDRKSVV